MPLERHTVLIQEIFCSRASPLFGVNSLRLFVLWWNNAIGYFPEWTRIALVLFNFKKSIIPLCFSHYFFDGIPEFFIFAPIRGVARLKKIAVK